MTIKKQWAILEEYEMNKLKIGVSTEIEILTDKENKIRNTIVCLKNKGLN